MAQYIRHTGLLITLTRLLDPRQRIGILPKESLTLGLQLLLLLLILLLISIFPIIIHHLIKLI